MAVSRKAVIFSLLVLVSLAVPVGDVNGFPDNIRTTATDLSSSANTSCFTPHVNQTYRIRSVEVTRTVRETQLVRTCCAGFSGEHCNITNTTSPQPQEVSADDPCGNLTYSSYVYLDAVCAVVTKCGEKIPVFLNSAGIAVDCGSHRPKEELRTETKCGNVCPFDHQCLGKMCSLFPNAVCVTTPSDCKLLWLLETGVRVDCSTGEQISPQRAKRQSTKSPTCISFPIAKTFGRNCNPVVERCFYYGLLGSQVKPTFV